jgi:PrpF protein
MNRLFPPSRFTNLSPRFIPNSLFGRPQNASQRTIRGREVSVYLTPLLLTARNEGVRTSQRLLPAAYWRGGTSRAVIFQRKDLPPDEKEWPWIFLRVLGSPGKFCHFLTLCDGGHWMMTPICRQILPSTNRWAWCWHLHPLQSLHRLTQLAPLSRC